jgi:hypothetical protein
MANPKFSVGELVILQSKRFPHLNGEYTVVAIPLDGTEFIGYRCVFPEIAYAYDVGLRMDAGKPGKPTLVRECLLRKKHLPGELSYHQLIKSLDQPVKHNTLAWSGRGR